MDKGFEKIHSFIVCPGARNQPFLKLEGIESKIIFHFDERAAAFEALGMSKQTDKPCAVVTTSGTAVGETLPAVMEAYHSHLKLIVISYDRPDRLKSVYAPQTTHQENCLVSFIRSTTLDDDRYPKHININADLEEKKIILPIAKLQYPLVILNENAPLTHDQYRNLKETNCLIHQEVTSPFFQMRTDEEILDDEQLDSLYMQGLFSCIIRMGSMPNCGIWRKLERTVNPPEVNHFTQEASLGLSFGKNRKGSVGEILKVFDTHKNKFELKNMHSQLIDDFPLSEIFQLRKIICERDSDDTIFYLGNSLTIRNAKHCPIKKSKIMVSRGLNGIDCQLSTALGIANGTEKKVVAIVGDQTFMYDANIIFREMPKNFEVFIINNGGGEIFKRYSFDARMVNGHTMTLSDKIVLPPNFKEVLISRDHNTRLWEKLK